jgi:hypothetical protein
MPTNPTYVKPRLGDPGAPTLMDHLANLYLDAGIVTPVVTPTLPNPAANPQAYRRLYGTSRRTNTR